MTRGGISHPIEMVETVLEVADVAWSAMEFSHNHLHHHDQQSKDHPSPVSDKELEEEKEIASLRFENQRLRRVLEENLKLFKNLSESHCLSKDCPPDLHKRLVATVDSTTFLTQLESLRQASLDASTNNFPFEEATEADLHSVEILVNGESSWWVWVTDEKHPNSEERSGIDDESYVVVSEEHVVDGVANFMAKCILSNPKAKMLSPEELQKTLASALGGVNKLEQMVNIWHVGKMFYALSTWGLALTGLYQHRAILKVAAKGIGASGKVIMMAL